MPGSDEQGEESTHDSGSESLYVYSIPIETDDGVDKACYSVPDGTGVLSSRYTSTHHVVVVRDAVPHFHKDASSVDVEKTTESEYRDEGH